MAEIMRDASEEGLREENLAANGTRLLQAELLSEYLDFSLD